jgi:hypothetical protein
MPRPLLRDDQGERIKDLRPGHATDCGVTAKNHRLCIEAVLWMARKGRPWRNVDALLAGGGQAYGSGSSRRSAMTPIGTRGSSTVPWSAPTSTQPAPQKRRPVRARAEDQNPSPGRCEGQPAARAPDGRRRGGHDAGPGPE